MGDKIRVMHITGWLDTGGVEEILMMIAKFNLKEKHEPAFITTCTKNGFVSSQIEKLGYKVYRLNITNKVYDLRIIPKLISVFKEFKPQIVHFYTKISILGMVAAKIAGVPRIIVNEIDMDWGDWGLGLRIASAIKKKLGFFADKIVASSIAVRKYWDEKESDKYIVIHEPCDVSKFSVENYSDNGRLYKNGEYPVLGIVARVWPKKGHEYLIKAMPRILNAFPSTRLKIVGTGPLLDEMRKLAASLGITEAVEFTGFVENLNQEMQSMDIFVFPTLTEAFPICVMEAMASGLPVAASTVGGIPEMVEEGKTGLLFPAKDSDSIADVVIIMLKDFEEAKKMGQKGREKVLSEFSPKTYLKKLDSLYQELL